MATASPFSWASLESMPTKRVFSTPVEVEGIIYVVGGCDARGTPLDTFEGYNAKKRKWFRLANMPSKRAGVCAVAIGKKIFAMGGVNTKQEPMDSVEVYDIEQKKWLSQDDGIESLRDRLLGLSGVVRDGKVLLVGGMGFDTNPKDYFMSYDPETNKWKSLPPMPTPRYATFSFLINDMLYVLGGRQGKLPVAAFEVYSFADSKWRTLPNIPSKRVFALYTHSDSHIFSVGGLNQDPKDGFSDAAEVFDLQTETWKTGKPMPTKRGDFAVGYINDCFIAAGGLGNQGKPLTAVESYDPSSDTWTSLPELPSPHCSCAFLYFQNKLHVIGGLGTNGPSGSMEALGVKSS